MTAQSSISQSQYVGRFAPSPSGPLHFGSLVTALGSFIQAKSNDGKWLLRIEDIDPPREVSGATDDILRCLESHHLVWDGDVVFQSQRSELYSYKIDWLIAQGHSFFCQCTRAQLARLKRDQLCTCIEQRSDGAPSAVRFKHISPITHFTDQLLGVTKFQPNELPAQFSIKRKDGLFAYQLAVVVDDIEQGITEIARGADLLPATAFQLALYHAFKCPAPQFLHFPVVVSSPGKKLSKQNHAPAVDNNNISQNLVQALNFLGLSTPSEFIHLSAEEILSWAIKHWDLRQLVAKTEQIDNRIG